MFCGIAVVKGLSVLNDALIAVVSWESFLQGTAGEETPQQRAVLTTNLFLARLCVTQLYCLFNVTLSSPACKH